MKKILLASVLSALPFVANANDFKTNLEAGLFIQYTSDLVIESVTSDIDTTMGVECKKLKEFPTSLSENDCKKIGIQNQISCEEVQEIVRSFSSRQCTFTFSDDSAIIQFKDIPHNIDTALKKITPLMPNTKYNNETFIMSF